MYTMYVFYRGEHIISSLISLLQSHVNSLIHRTSEAAAASGGRDQIKPTAGA